LVNHLAHQPHHAYQSTRKPHWSSRDILYSKYILYMLHQLAAEMKYLCWTTDTWITVRYISKWIKMHWHYAKCQEPEKCVIDRRLKLKCKNLFVTYKNVKILVKHTTACSGICDNNNHRITYTLSNLQCISPVLIYYYVIYLQHVLLIIDNVTTCYSTNFYSEFCIFCTLIITITAAVTSPISLSLWAIRHTGHNKRNLFRQFVTKLISYQRYSVSHTFCELKFIWWLSKQLNKTI